MFMFIKFSLKYHFFDLKKSGLNLYTLIKQSFFYMVTSRINLFQIIFQDE